MNANELADKLMSSLTMEYDCDKYMEQAAPMLRQQQAEIEALKMGFANSGTHDSELAETRAMAGRLFLKVQDLEFEQQEQINNLKQWEKRQLDLIESLELQLHTTLTNRNLEKPAKYSDAWWKEVAEFNKARKAQKK